MYDYKVIGRKIKESLGLRYYPVGMYFSEEFPKDVINTEKQYNGCIVPLIFSSAKGKGVAFNKNNTGRDCAAFFMGYKDWIFKGVENFLSDGMVFGRAGERFIKTGKQAKEYLKSFIPRKINTKTTVFKPLQDFIGDECPEIIIFFVNPDELSGLIYLLHYNSPDKDNIIVTGLHSGCGSVVTMPVRYKSEGKKKAVIGMHDVSVRSKLPKDIMTITIPFELVREMYHDINNSFVITENWEKIKKRNMSDRN